MRLVLTLIAVILPAMPLPLAAQDDTSKNAPRPKPAQKSEAAENPVVALAARVKKSVVVVQFSGRTRGRGGLGSGFVISADGLIATNLHVIGEARGITVTMADGKKYDVTSIHATEKAMDLAIIKIDAKGLPALELGDSSRLKQGQPIIALGNPLGLKHSLVQGVVSGTREIDGKPMIQLAVPIEEGNSGGPVLDHEGRVVGIMTMKHRFTDNLGFAVEVNALKPLIAKPNPIAMSRWLTIGALDARDWRIHLGARWRQRAGRIHVSGQGSGFGGRALCFARHKPPELPYEVQVHIRLHNDDGAAGLILCGDGGEKHYGFYPTSGQMRLTRFDGPTVTSWSILQTLPVAGYRPGEWNTLKVRVTKQKLQCFLNDQLVIETTDTQYRSGLVGLAKFRHTEAEFRGFRVGKTLPPTAPSADTVARITALVRDIPPRGSFANTLLDKLTPQAAAGKIVLRDRARLLELQAGQLRELALVVHHRRVAAVIEKALKQSEQKIDLLHVALLIAWLDNDELDVDAYRKQFGRIGDDLAATLKKNASEADKLAALHKHFFEELAYHGSRIDYYNRSNSYLNEVIDDREGLPISLSVLFMELARRVDLKVVGVGLPGHFVVRYEPKKGASRLIDVFGKGRTMPAAEAERWIMNALDPEPTGEARKAAIANFLAASTRKSILVRMLSNLSSSAAQRRDEKAIRRYADVILAVDPGNLQQRGMRVQIAVGQGRFDDALADIDWLLENRAGSIDVRALRSLRGQVERAKAAGRR